MEKIYIGKIVSTHGIKGELKIISDFPYKEKVFIQGNTLIIDEKEYKINTYRHHKIYEMVTLDNYKNINEVEFLLRKKVYIDKDNLKLNQDEILDEELITYKVDSNLGEAEITEIFYASEKNKILRINIKNKEVLIPMNSPYIKKIDKKSQKIIVEIIDGMILWK